jgi:hypothetical protein
MKPRRFTGRAGTNSRMDPTRILLAVSGLYLLVVLGQLMARVLGFARQQTWDINDEEWICRESTTMLGISISKRTVHIPAASVVFHSSGSLGDPALLLTGAFWLFGLILWGVFRIHTGLLAGAPLWVFSGGLLILSGLVVDVGCFLLHQHLRSNQALQIGLLDGSILTLRDPDPPDSF